MADIGTVLSEPAMTQELQAALGKCCGAVGNPVESDHCDYCIEGTVATCKGTGFCR